MTANESDVDGLYGTSAYTTLLRRSWLSLDLFQLRNRFLRILYGLFTPCDAENGTLEIKRHRPCTEFGGPMIEIHSIPFNQSLDHTVALKLNIYGSAEAGHVLVKRCLCSFACLIGAPYSQNASSPIGENKDLISGLLHDILYDALATFAEHVLHHARRRIDSEIRRPVEEPGHFRADSDEGGRRLCIYDKGRKNAGCTIADFEAWQGILAWSQGWQAGWPTQLACEEREQYVILLFYNHESTKRAVWQ